MLYKMSILDIFKNSVDKDGVIKALEELNTFVENKDIDKNLEEEILDFGEYFVDNYEDKTYDLRLKHFGEEDSFILRVYDYLVEKVNEEYLFYEQCEDDLVSLDRNEQSELLKIYDNINFYPGKKNICCQYQDGFVFSCELDEVLTKEQELELKGILAKGIRLGGIILIELIDSKIVTGLLFQDKNILTIRKSAIKRIHNINPYTGEKNKVKGFTYYEANKLGQKIANKKEA